MCQKEIWHGNIMKWLIIVFNERNKAPNRVEDVHCTRIVLMEWLRKQKAQIFIFHTHTKFEMMFNAERYSKPSTYHEENRPKWKLFF